MNILLIGTTLLIIVILLEAFLKEKKKRVELRYKAVDSLMNKSEKEFFYVLSDSLKDQYHIFSKVRLLDIFTIPKHLNFRHRQILKNYIQSKHVDFLLCDKATMKPIVAIELDGKSHLSKKRKERDELVNQVFDNAHMQLIHVPASVEMYCGVIIPST